MTSIIAATLIFFLQNRPGMAGAGEAQHLTTGGWVFLIGAWVFILTLVYYTFSKVLRGGGK